MDIEEILKRLGKLFLTIEQQEIESLFAPIISYYGKEIGQNKVADEVADFVESFFGEEMELFSDIYFSDLQFDFNQDETKVTVSARQYATGKFVGTDILLDLDAVIVLEKRSNQWLITALMKE